MWIKSQDGKRIVNTDNVTSIFLEYIHRGNTDALKYINILTDNPHHGGVFELGKYETESKATEVLNRIYESITDKDSFYLMPEN